MANFSLRGILKGHGGWVTSIATTSESSNTILTSSRDKSVLVWHLTRGVAEYGYAKKALRGHGHFVQDVVISSDGQFALSASWDGTLRLWDLATGETTRRFISHNKDVLSVAFSPDNRQIVSASRDRNIKLWNTLAQCKYTLEDAHSGWVSSVRFSPNPESPVFVSGSWDNTVKVWSLSNFSCQETLRGHTGYINAVTVSPDGSLCATGGKDGKAILWDLNEGSQVFAWNTGSVINNLVFSPKHYWLCAATNTGVHVFDLESKEKLATLEVCLKQTDLDSVISEQSKKASALSLAWSADGVELFAGYNDGFVRVWSPE